MSLTCGGRRVGSERSTCFLAEDTPPLQEGGNDDGIPEDYPLLETDLDRAGSWLTNASIGLGRSRSFAWLVSRYDFLMIVILMLHYAAAAAAPQAAAKTNATFSATAAATSPIAAGASIIYSCAADY